MLLPSDNGIPGALPSVAGLAGSRRPRLRILANGAVLAGVMSAEVRSSNYYCADRFRVAAALGTTPSVTARFWASSDDVLLDVQMLPGQDEGSDGWVSIVQGAVDAVRIDAIANVISLEGRDLSARLIEARTQETFANRTSSEIVTLLAQRHGLDVDIQATTTPVGRYWQLEHDSITLDSFSRATTEWDLLVTLAQYEGFDVWVSGSTLHFRQTLDAVSDVVAIRPIATASGPPNVTSLQLERALTLARDIDVTVKSWNSRHATAFVQTARSTVGQQRSGTPQRYVYVVPNLTPDAALKLAQRRLAELSRHERVLVADMPGDILLTPRMQLRLEGTSTAFDQIYWIDEIERRLDVPNGFTQRVRAKNASPRSQATAATEPVN